MGGDDAMKSSPPAGRSPETSALVDRCTSAAMSSGDKRKKKRATNENKQTETPEPPGGDSRVSVCVGSETVYQHVLERAFDARASPTLCLRSAQ